MDLYVICVKCQKKEKIDMSINTGDYHCPVKWEETDVGTLCPECLPAYKAHLEKFMEGQSQ